MKALIAAAALALATSASAHDLGQAKYLGNEGILVAKGGTKVLFDAFYSESFDGQYSLVPGALETQMVEGRAPFDGVDAVFISHVHPDHFDPRKTIAYMRAQPNVRLYAGRDVVAAIRAGAASDPLMQRVVMVDVTSGGEPAKFAIDGLEIEAFSIPHHGELPIPHYAFRVTLDRLATVMHLGDAGSDDRHFAPYQAEFDKKATSFTFAPVWMLTDAGAAK